MTEHIKQKCDIKNLTDQKELAEAIERCNLPPDKKRLLRVLYLEGGTLDDVCDAVGREYTTVSKWHKASLAKLTYLLQKQGKI